MWKYNLIFGSKISYEWDPLIWNPGTESVQQQPIKWGLPTGGNTFPKALICRYLLDGSVKDKQTQEKDKPKVEARWVSQKRTAYTTCFGNAEFYCKKYEFIFKFIERV